jgi:hypothetical protein
MQPNNGEIDWNRPRTYNVVKYTYNALEAGGFFVEDGRTLKRKFREGGWRPFQNGLDIDYWYTMPGIASTQRVKGSNCFTEDMMDRVINHTKYFHDADPLVYDHLRREAFVYENVESCEFLEEVQKNVYIAEAKQFNTERTLAEAIQRINDKLECEWNEHETGEAPQPWCIQEGFGLEMKECGFFKHLNKKSNKYDTTGPIDVCVLTERYFADVKDDETLKRLVCHVTSELSLQVLVVVFTDTREGTDRILELSYGN